MSLSESSAKGDRLQTLRDLRDFLARQIEECESKRDVASLTARFESVLETIADLEPKKAEGDGIDEIAKRRAARRAGRTPDSGRSKRTS